MDAVLNTLEKAVKSLDEYVRKSENEAANGLEKLTNDIKKASGKFSLPRPELAKLHGDTDKLTGSNGLGKPISE